jgi:hypothetical protein
MQILQIHSILQKGGIKFGMPYRVDKRKAPEISDPGAFSQQILSQYQEDHGFTHA